MKNRKFNWKYALGEILIVSVGILIAFGINTLSSKWNKESHYLEYKESLIADLDQNLNNLTRIIAVQEEKVVELNQVIRAIDANEIDLDEIGRILFKQRKSPTFYPIIGTFKSLVSQGEIELFSTEIKRELFNLYDTKYQRTVYNGNLYDDMYLKIYDREIRDIIDFRKKIIDNPERLREKDFLKNILFIVDEAESYLGLIKKCKSESELMLSMLRK